MNNIQGNAKRYNGQAVDYVLLFDWLTGDCLGTVTPSEGGVWSYDYNKALTIGITYVADGCEPITHGPYQFIPSVTGLFPSGYLLLSATATGIRREERFDKTATDHKDWIANFSHVLDIAILDYAEGSTTARTPYREKVINDFQFWWELLIVAYNGQHYNDISNSTLEVLDENNNVLFALKNQREASFKTALYYGVDLGSLTKTSQTSNGSAVATSGTLRFYEDKVVFQNERASNFNDSFSMAVDLRDAVKVRVSGESFSSKTNTGAGFATSYILLQPVAPSQ